MTKMTAMTNHKANIAQSAEHRKRGSGFILLLAVFAIIIIGFIVEGVTNPFHYDELAPGDEIPYVMQITQETESSKLLT